MQRLSVKTVVSAGLSCALAACALLGAAPAQAQGYPGGSGGYPGSTGGHWKATDLSSGTCNRTEGFDDDDNPVIRSEPIVTSGATVDPLPATYSWREGYDYGGGSGTLSGPFSPAEAYVRMVGTAQYKLTWVPNGAGAVPPATIYVRENGEAHTSYHGPTCLVGGSEDAIDTPLLPTQNVVVNPLGGPVQDQLAYDGVTIIGQSQRNTVITPIAVPTQPDNNGEYSVLLPPRAFQAKVTATGWIKGDIEAGFDYWVDVVDYSLSLHRSGARGERTINGTIYSDSIFSYNQQYALPVPEGGSYAGVGSHPIENWQSFSPSFGSDWHSDFIVPNVTATWSPAGDYDDTYTTNRRMPFGSPNKDPWGNWTGSTSTPGQIYSLTYTATAKDQLGVTATATHIVNLHDPYEQKSIKTQHLNVNKKPASGGAWVTATSDGNDLNVYLENSVGWTVGASINGDVDIARFIAGCSLGVSLDASVQYTANVGAGEVVHNVQKGWGSYPEQYDCIVEYTGDADTWDAGGFTGNKPFDFSVPDNPAGGIEAGPLTWRGGGDPPQGDGHLGDG